MRRRVIQSVVAAAVLSVVLASCGQAVAIAVVRIVPGISGPSYRPALVRIVVGTEVTWINEDRQRVCTVTAVDNNFGTRFLRYGQRYTLRFNAPGTYRYFCENDRRARGEVIVKR